MARHPSYFEYAARLDHHTIGPILAFAEAYGFSLANEFASVLDTQYEVNPYVNMIWDVTRGVPTNFGVVNGNTLNACWHEIEGQRGPFQRIWKNSY